MNDNKVTLVGFISLLICLGLAWGVYFVSGQLKVLKERYDSLEQTKANLEQDRDSLRAQIRVFNDAFASLEDYNVRAAPSDGEFYRQVQNEIQPYIDRGEIRISRTEPRPLQAGRSSISFTLQGDYYSFMRILAAWRNMETTVRVSQFSVTALSDAQMAGEIEASVTLEAIVSAQ